MSESFAELFKESVEQTQMRPGSLVRGQVVALLPGYVVVNAGLKSESPIPVTQFHNENGELEVQVGDEVDVVLDTVEDGFGETRLSREKAKRSEAWIHLARAFENGEVVTGMVTGKVKGGFTVELGTIRAFLPGSLVDVRPMRDSAQIEGKELELKVIKLDQKRNNVVVSRRAVLESATSAQRDTLLSNLQEGQEVTGVVKNLTDYGAFIDLGGIDGLLHITDMSWKRVKHPSEIVTVGDEIRVKVLKFDRERSRVSLGLKQLGEDPWVNLADRYPPNSRLSGKVTNLTDYGCFVEIEPGIEGLVHASEMDWTNKNVHPAKLVSVGDEVGVIVLDVDEDRRRISLGIKQCTPNPWQQFAEQHQKGDRISGKIKSITDFGLFIGLDGGIDGLVHLSDLSWQQTGEDAIRAFKKGDEVEAMVLAVDAERERISLGIKQLSGEPFGDFVNANGKGAAVKGTVREVDAKGAIIDIQPGIEGYLRASEIAKERVDDARNYLKVGDEVDAKILSVDRKNRQINLSLKAVESDEGDTGGSAPKETKAEPVVSTTSLGDLLKEQMGNLQKND